MKPSLQATAAAQSPRCSSPKFDPKDAHGAHNTVQRQSQRSQRCLLHYPGTNGVLFAKIMHTGKMAIEGNFMILKREEVLLIMESVVYA